MILRKLLSPETIAHDRRPMAHRDHTLLTEMTEEVYTCPDHEPGLGLLTMLSGSGRLLFNRQRETLTEGEFLLIDRGTRLSIELPRGVRPLFLFFDTTLVTEAVDTRATDWCWLERVHPLPDGLRQQLHWLADLRDNCSSFAALKADSMIRGILEELSAQSRLAATLSADLPVAHLSTRVRLYKRLSTTREWILANYASPLTLADMAKVAALNSQHFLRMFRDCYSITPHRFLTDTRLEAARTMLLQSRTPVSVICRLTGFESLSAFSWLFRQRFGRSPRAYREK
jgi:AraC family transcriptional regulator